MVLVLALVLSLKPPYPHAEAKRAPVQENINNSRQAVNHKEQTVQAKANESTVKPVVQPRQEPSPQPPQPVTHPTGCENYQQLVSRYNWNVNVMLQIMRAESGCNPYAVGDTWAINGLYAPSCGLFQVRTLQGRPSCEALKDPATNIEWAYKIYLGQGYGAWSVCRTKVSCW